ncbi:uncharacterized protein LOC132267031 [Cornus florida]|uniref:uncharacterized protein LOC132267031 n=1 Tax=Cornus florida TaxID=4283 RepID=UPI00289B478C|nr:uncharacterized protein LOC132267031 [Cornus florida]
MVSLSLFLSLSIGPWMMGHQTKKNISPIASISIIVLNSELPASLSLSLSLSATANYEIYKNQKFKTHIFQFIYLSARIKSSKPINYIKTHIFQFPSPAVPVRLRCSQASAAVSQLSSLPPSLSATANLVLPLTTSNQGNVTSVLRLTSWKERKIKGIGWTRQKKKKKVRSQGILLLWSSCE